MPWLTHTISIRQQYVELILAPTKKTECRNRCTDIRGRGCQYAAKKPVDWPAGWQEGQRRAGRPPYGVVVRDRGNCPLPLGRAAAMPCLRPTRPEATPPEATF